jgi:hypothetical protein
MISSTVYKLENSLNFCIKLFTIYRTSFIRLILLRKKHLSVLSGLSGRLYTSSYLTDQYHIIRTIHLYLTINDLCFNSRVMIFYSCPIRKYFTY